MTDKPDDEISCIDMILPGPVKIKKEDSKSVDTVDILSELKLSSYYLNPFTVQNGITDI
jgi:hypothetical protein